MGVARAVDRDRVAALVATAEVGRVLQARAQRAQLGDEYVARAPVRGRKGAGGGEVGREGLAGDVGTVEAVDGDAEPNLVGRAA